MTFYTESMLGQAVTKLGRFEEAESLLVGGYEGMKAREDKIPAIYKYRRIEALQRLIDLYIAWDKPEVAAKWQAILDTAKAETEKAEE